MRGLDRDMPSKDGESEVPGRRTPLGISMVDLVRYAAEDCGAFSLTTHLMSCPETGAETGAGHLLNGSVLIRQHLFRGIDLSLLMSGAIE